MTFREAGEVPGEMVCGEQCLRVEDPKPGAVEKISGLCCAQSGGRGEGGGWSG